MSDPATNRHPAFDFTFHPSVSPFTASQQSYLAAHPDAIYQYIATGAIILDAATTTNPPRILLLQRSAGDSMPNKWEIPGGGCDDDDASILHGVARELWEEAGLRATRIGPLVGEPHLFTSRSGKQICKFNFSVRPERDARGGLEVVLDPEEHQRFVWASDDEVRARRVGDLQLEFTTREQVDTVLLAFKQARET